MRDTVGPSVQLPNNNFLPSSKQGEIPLSKFLTAIGTNAMVLPGLKSSSLISLGQLCDDNCNVLLTKTHLYVIKNKKIILTGTRNINDGLWDIPIQRKINNNYKIPPSHSAMYAAQSNTKCNSITMPVQVTQTKQQYKSNTFDVNSIRNTKWDYILQQQVQRDNKQYSKVHITDIQHKLLVIIRQK